MTINGADNHFFGHWTWETDDKKWISWKGQKISDFHDSSHITDALSEVGTAEGIYSLQGVKLEKAKKGVNIVNGKKMVVK